MGKSFSELKKRLRCAAWIKCALFGVALGILGTAVYAILQKLLGASPALPLCLAIGAGVALVAFLAMALIVRPTEKRIAKTLDERLGLREKVQTMVAFRDASGTLVEMQREDTERVLREATKKQLRSGHAWIHLILPVLAIAALTVSVLLPAAALPEPSAPPAEDGEQDEAWALTEWHITAVRALIDEVRASDMVDTGKTEIVAALEKMLTDLQSVNTVANMKATVIGTLVTVDGVADGINTYTAIFKALDASASITVKEFNTVIGKPSDPIEESKYQEFKLRFGKETLAEDAATFGAVLGLLVDQIAVSHEDALWCAIKELSDGMIAFSAEAPNLGEGAAEQLSALLDASAEQISEALGQQNANRAVANKTNSSLMSIFGVTWEELPDSLKYPDDAEAGTEDGNYEEKEDDIITDGGLGSGEVIYGSNDAVYDRDQGAHVVYGDVIDTYDGIKTSELEERPISDALKDYIDKYFADLYHKDEDEN